MLASPKGGLPPVDPLSREDLYQTAESRRFEADASAQARLAATVPLASASPAGFDALFYPGGHGPMWDLTEDPASISLIEGFLVAEKPVGLLCHASGALRHVKKPDGRPLVEGLQVTGFSNSEEVGAGSVEGLPFLVEDELKAKGGIYSCGPDWTSHAVSDGLLVTGQNPASLHAASARLLQLLAVGAEA